jgi:hypothetical protein
VVELVYSPLYAPLLQEGVATVEAEDVEMVEVVEVVDVVVVVEVVVIGAITQAPEMSLVCMVTSPVLARAAP